MHRVLTAVAFSLALVGCDNECSFTEQCDGNILQTCGEGVDQMFGRRVSEVACEGAAPTCQEIDNQNAMCVTADAESCEIGDAGRCEQDVLVTCEGVSYTEDVGYPTAYWTAVDCAELDGSCVTDRGDGAPGCADGADTASGS